LEKEKKEKKKERKGGKKREKRGAGRQKRNETKQNELLDSARDKNRETASPFMQNQKLKSVSRKKKRSKKKGGEKSRMGEG